MALYRAVAELGAYSGTGDYLFSAGVLHPSSSTDAYFEAAWDRLGLRQYGGIEEFRFLATSFAERQARTIADVAKDNSIVGLSSTFTQTVASLAFAQRLKGLRPDIFVVLGGYNVNPERAEVLLRLDPWLDYCVAGDGEAALVSLAAQLDDGGAVVVPGVRGRDADRTTGDLAVTWDLNASALPSFSSFFEQLTTAGMAAEIEPALCLEISRGCWWGQKRHCTFCGLNHENMTFRRRERSAADDIVKLVNDYEVLDVFFADNILHPDDIDHVFGRLPADWDLRIHLEVKVDLTFTQLLELRQHGVWHLQPGIESLSRRTLGLMRKGATPVQCVRFLRHTEELGITCTWNYLIGFPGETPDDHASFFDQQDKLAHLQPPGFGGEISIVRYSPLFTDPDLGLPNLVPSEYCRALFAGFDDSDIFALSDVFEPRSGVAYDVGLRERVRSAVTRWKAGYAESRLVETEEDGRVIVERIHLGRSSQVLVLSEPADVDLWRILREGASRQQIITAMDTMDWADIQLRLQRWSDVDRVVFTDGGAWIATPTRYYDHLPEKMG